MQTWERGPPSARAEICISSVPFILYVNYVQKCLEVSASLYLPVYVCLAYIKKTLLCHLCDLRLTGLTGLKNTKSVLSINDKLRLNFP